MTDATHLKAIHGSRPAKKGDVPCRIGRPKGGLNSKLHVVCNAQGKPVVLLLSERQMSDYKGARMLLPSLPKAKTLVADRGYDAAWFRAAWRAKGITACIPAKRNRKTQVEYDKTLYRQRHRIENMFGWLSMASYDISQTLWPFLR